MSIARNNLSPRPLPAQMNRQAEAGSNAQEVEGFMVRIELPVNAQLRERLRQIPLDPREQQFFNQARLSAKLRQITGTAAMVIGAGLAVHTLCSEDKELGLLSASIGLVFGGVIALQTANSDQRALNLAETAVKVRRLAQQQILLQNPSQNQ